MFIGVLRRIGDTFVVPGYQESCFIKSHITCIFTNKTPLSNKIIIFGPRMIFNYWYHFIFQMPTCLSVNFMGAGGGGGGGGRANFVKNLSTWTFVIFGLISQKRCIDAMTNVPMKDIYTKFYMIFQSTS